MERPTTPRKEAATWRSASDGLTGSFPPLILVADPADPRARSWGQACARLGLPVPRVVSWGELCSRRDALDSLLRPGEVVRIDSPGRGFATYQALLEAGIETCEAEGLAPWSQRQIAEHQERRGEVWQPGQWFAGMRVVLDAVARVPGICLPMAPQEILRMFDKQTCSRELGAAGIPVPRPLAPVRCHEELVAAMETERVSRVFVKLRYGSSAAAMVAYQRRAGRQVAYTTAELEDGDLFATRRVRRLTGHAEISAIIDAVCARGVHVEEWVPKAGVCGRTCDLRVVSVERQPVLAVARLSRSPFTNLHLGGERAPSSILRQRTPPAVWQVLLQTCAQTHALFPRAVQVGIDVALDAAFRSVKVLEVNAFGDHVKADDSEASPQEAQLRLLQARSAPS